MKLIICQVVSNHYDSLSVFFSPIADSVMWNSVISGFSKKIKICSDESESTRFVSAQFHLNVHGSMRMLNYKLIKKNTLPSKYSS